ncbi:MAG: arsenite methyltransferase [Actinomycetia bacterium]|nr:arsenite methyltransferase [Actinomycetes bacterium]
MPKNIDLRETVRDRYADAACSVDQGCCAPAYETNTSNFGRALYPHDDIITVPAGASDASLGCGNPTSVAELSAGETVLDLGSGAGIDVLLSAERVGPTGFAYGIDMTDEMLDLARRHADDAGATNVEFRKGYIEAIPLDEASVDVIISNCVINLAADKSLVFAEMHRVLRPGGRIGISDVVASDALNATERAERGNWVGCIAGALSFAEYEEGLKTAGFTGIEITVTHDVADGMHSATVRATKPN